MVRIDGSFMESRTDEHVSRRRFLLEGGVMLPSAQTLVCKVRVEDLQERCGLLLGDLERDGILAFELDRVPTNEEFMALGALLGQAMPESAPEVQPYVEHGVILNVINDNDYTTDTSLQPFATNPLTLHSESSGRKPSEQPRYIVLMCCEEGGSGGAQTLIVPMAAVSRDLSPGSLAALSCTRYSHNDDGAHIVRQSGERVVFAFRDFFREQLSWSYRSEELPLVGVNVALRELLASMYEPQFAMGVQWTPGKVVIIDNTFFFHGRTAAHATSVKRRHLKRLRILGRPETRSSQ